MPPTVMLVMALRQAELSVNVTSNAPSTVALPAAVKVGGVKAAAAVPVITTSSIRYWVADPVCLKRILRFAAAGKLETDLENQVAVPVPVDRAVYEPEVQLVPSVLYSKSKSDPVAVVLLL